MTDTKLICFYLPQFHETEYNNRWWGQGYTDWMASKNARQYFKGHRQPRIPLNQNYYDLSEKDAAALKWQADLAGKYGIYGFCIYHYWFPEKRLLEKPVEILREHKEIDIHYSLCWDSKTWKRTWYADKYEEEVLMQQDFGDKKIWEKHFFDLLPDFQDRRYIKIDNKPVFHIYQAYAISCLAEMKECWNKLAVKNGFDGIYLVIGDVEHRGELAMNRSVDAFYNYEPMYAFYESRNSFYGRMTVARAGIIKRINKYFYKSFLPDKRDARTIYDKISAGEPERDKKTYLGLFSDYDDTPRRQLKGAVYVNNDIRYFQRCLARQLQKSRIADNEFLYINAWNEWGESAYLEPDEENGFRYLEAVKEEIQRIKELEDI